MICYDLNPSHGLALVVDQAFRDARYVASSEAPPGIIPTLSDVLRALHLAARVRQGGGTIAHAPVHLDGWQRWSHIGAQFIQRNSETTE